MLQIKSKLKAARAAYNIQVRGELRLAFAQRQQARQQARLASGEEVALMLPRGEALRGGDLVTASDGRVIEVVAAAEDVLHVECASATELARVAYRLGDRHVPVQLGEGFLRVGADSALEEMLKALGAKVRRVQAPFEPGEQGSAGAHGHGHDHGHEHCAHPGHRHDHGHER